MFAIPCAEEQRANIEVDRKGCRLALKVANDSWSLGLWEQAFPLSLQIFFFVLFELSTRALDPLVAAMLGYFCSPSLPRIASYAGHISSFHRIICLLQWRCFSPFILQPLRAPIHVLCIISSVGFGILCSYQACYIVTQKKINAVEKLEFQMNPGKGRGERDCIFFSLSVCVGCLPMP